VSDEYGPDGRFAWDMIEMAPAELDEMAALIDDGRFDEAEAVVAKAEACLFHEA
jgi:hypothetical protein